MAFAEKLDVPLQSIHRDGLILEQRERCVSTDDEASGLARVFAFESGLVVQEQGKLGS